MCICMRLGVSDETTSLTSVPVVRRQHRYSQLQQAAGLEEGGVLGGWA